MIYDGTRGVYLNYGIRVRDQLQFPTAPDIQAVLAELYEERGSKISLLFDVSKAHRRVLVLEEEWGRQACQVRGTAAATARARRAKGDGASAERDGKPPPLRRADFSAQELADDVYVNKVETFGVSSAG